MSAVTIWGVTYLMHSTLLIAVVAIVARFIRSASVRDTLWKVALIGGIVTATLQVLAPVERILPARVPQRMQVTMPAPESTVVATPVVATQPSRVDRTSLAAIAYALIALLLLARIFVGRRRFLAAVGDRTELLLGPARELLDALAARARCTKPIRLSTSESVASPVAMLGWEIVIPSDTFARLSAEQQETILAHELGHLLRRDPLWLTLAEAVKALLFFQPLNWLTAAKLKETAEFLCDDAAVLQTGNQRALAETLAELASNIAPAPPAVAAMAEGGSNLIARVQRVLRAHPSAPLPVSVRFALALLVLGAMALFAPAFGIVTAAAATTRTPGQANDFTDASLRQTFEGPDGTTHVKFVAHEAQVALDGSWVRFNNSGGFVRVDQEADRVTRHIEVVPGPSLDPKYRYVVNGDEKPWCDDARRAMISGFLAEEAYDGETAHKNSTWAANYSRTDDDGKEVKAHIQLDYDNATGALDVNTNTIVQVIETSSAGKRSFVFDPRGARWIGSWSGVTRETWLRRILRDAGANEKVLDAILNY
ncbi:MAG: hypothetical protein DMF56_23540 [Acidobacteria bacterium]|nr:MAG: hypothetical protein DMF56_23540 [Acidobacteriota bacterium]